MASDDQRDWLADYLVKFDEWLRSGAQAGSTAPVLGDAATRDEAAAEPVTELASCLERLSQRWPGSDDALEECLLELEEQLREQPSDGFAAHDSGVVEPKPDLKGCLARLAKRWPQVGYGYGEASIPEGIGRFQIKQVLGEGGFARVFLAYDAQLERQVAIKVPHDRLPGREEDNLLYLAEARSVAALDHPNIVPVYDVAQTEQFRLFVVSKFIDGTTLADRIHGSGFQPSMQARHLAYEEIGELVATVAEALHYAHVQGITHRDIKPSNILLDVDGQPHIVDFGLALRDSDVGQGPRYAGTLAYMSPEQAQGQAHCVDGRSDVYSLGVVLYEMLLGRLPFTTESRREMIEQITTEKPTHPHHIDITVPLELERICLTSLSKHAADRHSSAAEMATALRRWLNQVRRKRAMRRRCVIGCLAAVSILAVASVFGYEVNGRFQARALINNLSNAQPDAVLKVSDKLRRYKRWAHPRLKSIVAGRPRTPAEARRILHARMSLARDDPAQIAPLVDALLDENTSAAQVQALVTVLKPHSSKIEGQLWSAMHDDTKLAGERFRAGLALATFDNHADRWTVADRRLLAGQLVAANPDHQQTLRVLLRPIHNLLIDDLQRQFIDTQSALAQVSAANALLDFVGDDGKRMANLLSEATPAQYAVLYPAIKQMDEPMTMATLRELVARRPPFPALPAPEPTTLGHRRARAAITLLRRGERGVVFDALNVEHDISLLLHFVHRCRDYGVRPEQLIECLNAVQQRRSGLPRRVGALRQPEDDAMYGLLLALGEFTFDELPAEVRGPLIERLIDWYATDPSSAVHGATGWLLRNWGYLERTQLVDRTPVSYDPNREWFTLKIEPLAASQRRPGPRDAGVSRVIFLTFVVIPAGEYTIETFSTGEDWYLLKPDGDVLPTQGREFRTVQVSRPFAMLDRNITYAELQAFGLKGFRNTGWKFPAGNRTALGVSWFDAVGFCRWLTERHGLAEDKQAFTSLESPTTNDTDIDAQESGERWSLQMDRPGFRLPTFVERFIAGQARSIRSGWDASFADYYGCMTDAIATFGPPPPYNYRPNLIGLYGAGGYPYEWVNDQLPGTTSRVFMYRGVSTGWFEPANRHNRIGLRIAMTLPEYSVTAGDDHEEQEQ